MAYGFKSGGYIPKTFEQRYKEALAKLEVGIEYDTKTIKAMMSDNGYDANEMSVSRRLKRDKTILFVRLERGHANGSCWKTRYWKKKGETIA